MQSAKLKWDSQLLQHNIKFKGGVCRVFCYVRSITILSLMYIWYIMILYAHIWSYMHIYAHICTYMHIYAHICTYTYIQYIYIHILLLPLLLLYASRPLLVLLTKNIWLQQPFPPSVPQLWYHIKFCLACFGRTTVKYYDSSWFIYDSMIHHISDTASDTSDTSVDGILMLDADRWRTFRHTLLLLRPCVGHPWCPVDPVDPWPETWKTWHLADPGTYVGPLETSWKTNVTKDVKKKNRSKWGDMPLPSHVWSSDSFLMKWQTLAMKDTYRTTKSTKINQASLSRPAMRVQRHPYLRPAPRQLGGCLFNNIQEQYLLYYTQSSCQSSFSCLLSDCKKHCSGSFLWETCFSFSCSQEQNWHKVREHNKLWWVEDAIFGMVLRWDLAKTTLSDTFRIQWNAAHLCWHALAHRAHWEFGCDWSYLIIFVWICEKRLNYIKLITVTSLWRSDPKDGFACRSMISELTWQRHVPWVFSIQHQIIRISACDFKHPL